MSVNAARPRDPRIPQIYAAARRHRRALEDRNVDASERMYQAWQGVMADLRPRIDAITARIGDARAAGETVSPAWLYQQARYRELLDGARNQFDDYSRTVYNETTGLQRYAVDRAIDDSWELIRGAFGGMVSDPESPVVLIRPGAEEMRDLVGFLGDGSPLQTLLSTFGEQASRDIARALTVGITTGQSPIEIARSIRQSAGIPRTRAETIARTELHRTFRSATQRTFEANSDVVSGWIWHCAQQRRTCPACWAMHGTFHAVTERLHGHVRCRCAMLPQTKTFEELGIDGVQDERVTVPLGSDVFAQLKAADQKYILGATKYGMYRSGEITLADLATLKRNPVWGDSWQESTIAQARASAASREQAARRSQRAERQAAKPKAPTGQRAAPTAPDFKPGAQVRAEIEAEFRARYDNVQDLQERRTIADAQVRIAEDRLRKAESDFSVPLEERRRIEGIWREASKTYREIGTQLRQESRDLRKDILEGHLYAPEPAKIKASGTPRKPSDRSVWESIDRYNSWIAGHEGWTRLVGTGHLDGQTITYVKVNRRSHYTDDEIRIDSTEHGITGRVIVHEMGHWLEERSPGFHEEIYRHYQARTAGEAAVKLKDLHPNSSYDDWETTRRDKWISDYSGKDYTTWGLRNSEIVSMTLEQLYADPFGMIQQDPDTFDLVWRLLRSKNLPPKRRRKS